MKHLTISYFLSVTLPELPALKAVLPSIALLAILKIPVFFITAGTMGYYYAGRGSSNIYMLWMASVFLVSFLPYLLSFFKSPRLCRADVLSFGFIGILVLNHILWVPFGTDETLLPLNLQFFVILGLPGLFAARILSVWRLWPIFAKQAEVLVTLLSVGLFVVSVVPLLQGTFTHASKGVGGASYQAASYYAACCFGLLGFFLLKAGDAYRYRLFRTRLAMVLQVGLLVAVGVAAIVNAGRGAFLMLVGYGLLCVYWMVAGLMRLDWPTIKSRWPVWLLIVAGLGSAIVLARDQPVVKWGIHRATQFLSFDSGISLNFKTGSSGRDKVYRKAIDGIKEAPWIGHGAFHFRKKINQPHNVILNFCLQFGIPVGLFLAGFLAWQSFRPPLPANQTSWLLGVLAVYPFVHLTFSGEYLHEALLWFVCAGFANLQRKGR